MGYLGGSPAENNRRAALDAMVQLNGFDVIIVCTGTEHQAAFWQAGGPASKILGATAQTQCPRRHGSSAARASSRRRAPRSSAYFSARDVISSAAPRRTASLGAARGPAAGRGAGRRRTAARPSLRRPEARFGDGRPRVASPGRTGRADNPRRRVAATPRPRRGCSAETSRGQDDAAARTPGDRPPGRRNRTKIEIARAMFRASRRRDDGTRRKS